MSQIHIMIDLETMSMSMRAAIVSIGAVAFTADGLLSSIRNPFYRNVNLQSCLQAGLDVDGETVYWWLGQSEEARAALLPERLPISVALMHLREWIPDDAMIWSNGAAFDLPILRSAYDACGLTLPWSRKNEQCFRTLKGLTKGKVDLPPDPGTKHNALDDATWQATCAVQMLAYLEKQV